mgnify:CR=1 FL=1|tara:strand:+ start:461 stop:835 length:375 start_codon:yes stop_codon:yes gene_type:complete
MTQDRFTFEEQLMEVWHTSNDIRLIKERAQVRLVEIAAESYREPYNSDLHKVFEKMLSSFSGLEELHSLRCQKLMDTFEILVHEDQQDSMFSQYNWTDEPSPSTVDVDTIADKVSKKKRSRKTW